MDDIHRKVPATETVAYLSPKGLFDYISNIEILLSPVTLKAYLYCLNNILDFASLFNHIHHYHIL